MKIIYYYKIILFVIFCFKLNTVTCQFVSLQGAHSSYLENPDLLECESPEIKCEKVQTGDLNDLFKKILKTLSLSSDRIGLYEAKIIGTARYYKREHSAYIVYDNNTFATLTDERDLRFVGVIGHELGHFIHHHDDFCGVIKELELDADYYSGYVLEKLGYSEEDIDKFLKYLNKESSYEGYLNRYPSYEERKNKILAGFNNSLNGVGVEEYTDKNIEIFWEKIPEYKIIIKSKNKNQEFLITEIQGMVGGVWDEEGIVYIPDLNATIQLFYWKKKKKFGTGAIINNKTGITWRRKNDVFLIYLNGNAKHFKIAKENIKSCKESEGFCTPNNDLVVRYVDPATHDPVICVFENYKYSDNSILMPGRIVSQ